MKLGITGATGGLGKRFIEVLLQKNSPIEIKVFVRTTSNISSLNQEKVEFVFGSLQDQKSLETFVQDLDICYHFASCVNSDHKQELMETNVQGTQNLCEALLQNPKCHFIYCSSIVVKNLKPLNRVFASNYTLSKYYAEKVVKKYSLKIKTTIVHPGYIYGKYDQNMLPTVIKLLHAKVNFLLKGGQKLAPLVYIDDLCELFWLCAINEKSIHQEYIGIPKNEFGIHHFIQEVGKEMHLAYPKKVYPKLPFMLAAKFLEIRFKLFGGSQAKLTMRVVNGLSAKAKYTDNGQNNLDWHPKTVLGKRVKEAVESYLYSNLVMKNSGNEIISLRNDGRCKWLENKVLKKLLPDILENNRDQQKKKIYVIEDWISNDGGKVGVDLDWLHKLGVPIAKKIEDLPSPTECVVVNTGYDSIFNEERVLRKRGFELIDAPCPFVRKVRDHLLQIDKSKYQIVLLCEPKHIIIKNYSSLFPDDMILVQMGNYQEKILEQQNGKPLFLLPYVTFLPKHVFSIYDFICAEFPTRENIYVETKCMWVSSRLSPIEEINTMTDRELKDVKDSLLVTTAGSTNKSVISLTETLEMKGLHVITIGSLDSFKEYLETRSKNRILLVKSPIPNNAEKPILEYMLKMKLGVGV
ncbi:hypothetical protein FACS189418_1960 [Clostridia bacterium]|nr:hypothetical protein FACS189418_1960 [Clostridia bacterium]